MHFKASFDFAAALETNEIEPRAGMDDVYDDALKAIEKIKSQLDSERVQLSKKLGVRMRLVDRGKEKYQLEINKTDLEGVSVPSTFRIVSETKTCRRYYTPSLLSIISQFPDAEEQLNTAKEGILLRFVQRFNDSPKWQKIVMIIAQVDCLISLAKVSAHSMMCRPSFISTHPVSSLFVNFFSFFY
jgi:DNA mismatch repair ATPase MutS